MRDRIRVGAVSYLNARPLYDGLERLDPRVQLFLDYPSILAEMLRAGELDVGLIPSVEYLRGIGDHQSYKIIPGVSISTRGPVRSVKLLSRVALDEIKSLALDQGSRTSQVLTQVWLAERHGVRNPRLETLAFAASPLESRTDAVLLIGDRAMSVRDEAFLHVVDLGQAWKEMTGLPFVFALWVARSEVDESMFVNLLQRSRDDGLARVHEIAEKAANRMGLNPDFCEEYLTQNLCYEFDSNELAGFQLFAEKAAALGLAPQGAPLVFAHDRLHPATRG